MDALGGLVPARETHTLGYRGTSIVRFPGGIPQEEQKILFALQLRQGPGRLTSSVSLEYGQRGTVQKLRGLM